MKILAIETSCDETSIAVLQSEAGGSFKLLSNIVSSQVKVHAPFGGVVPMLAKREHQRNLLPILKKSLQESKLLKVQSSKFKVQNDNSKILKSKFLNLKSILDREPELYKKLNPFLKRYEKPKIDIIAVTNGPGLEPALWVGVNFAKALGYFWNLPVMPINHVEAHIVANWLPSELSFRRKPESRIQTWIPDQVRDDKLESSNHQSLVASRFPAICLVVSGGHTQLVLMKKFGEYKILGETRDDAAGEAFDKLAKMLNLGYPGGPLISKIASRQSLVASRSVKLPRPMLNSPDYDFSFSGLKTAALYFVKTLDKKTIKKLTPAICAEFQQAVVDVLISKTIRAAKEYNVKTIMLGGGVAANDLLRDSLALATGHLSLNFSLPAKSFCGDNAAMIALTAYKKISPERSRGVNLKKHIWQKIQVDGNLRLS